jgi:hypothetical protein
MKAAPRTHPTVLNISPTVLACGRAVHFPESPFHIQANLKIATWRRMIYRQVFPERRRPSKLPARSVRHGVDNVVHAYSDA